jgi:hypothetical protein
MLQPFACKGRDSFIADIIADIIAASTSHLSMLFKYSQAAGLTQIALLWTP